MNLNSKKLNILKYIHMDKTGVLDYFCYTMSRKCLGYKN